MGHAYDTCLHDAPRWQLALSGALSAQDADDLVVPYEDVARAFPDRNPHPDSFDIPLIDGPQLRAWAEGKDWQVGLATECGRPGFPAVRFTRRHN